MYCEVKIEEVQAHEIFYISVRLSQTTLNDIGETLFASYLSSSLSQR